MQTIDLKVSGMTCGSCVKHVEKAIQSIAEVEKVEVSLASGIARVQGNIAQKIDAIIAALKEDGYSAQVSLTVDDVFKGNACKSGSSCCCG